MILPRKGRRKIYKNKTVRNWIYLKKRVYDDDQDTFCLDWWAPNYTKIKEMARAQHVLHPAAPKFAEPKRFTGTPRTRPRNLSEKQP